MPDALDYRSCRQGGWNDCWLHSALDGLALKRPEEVLALVRDRGDGSYEVAFPGYEVVTVRPEEGGGAQSDWPWAAAIEAAAKRHHDDADQPRVATYGLGITLLTGRGRTGYTNLTGLGFAPPWRVWSRTAWLERRLADATAAGKLMVLGGTDGKWTKPQVAGIRPQHCYALLAYEPDTGTCRLRNPLGDDDGIPQGRKRADYGPGEFWLTLDETQGSFCGLTIED